MESYARRRVEVPDVVGLPFHVGRDLASDAGVTLANVDPDGPPIGELAWPGLFYIETQDPSPGSSLFENDSVRVTVVPHGAASESVPRRPASDPPVLAAHAEPDPEPEIVDLPSE
jgi:hypothetical protein